MRVTTKWILTTLTALIVVPAAIGCQVPYGDVPPTDDDRVMTAEEFVSHFNTQMIENEHRVGDWVVDGEVFILRLPDIRVGNDTLTYEPGGWFTSSYQALSVECSFNATKPVRQISNGDTVEIWGATTEAERGVWRIKLRMARCGVSKVEATP